MTARRRREFSEPAPGVVKVRVTGDMFDAGFLVRILRDHPEVEIVGPPAHCSGGRVYVKVRVRRDQSEAADIAHARMHPDPYASWVNGEPSMEGER